MTDPSPSEFVAAHELSRYPAEAVLRLIEAAKEWHGRQWSASRWRDDVADDRLSAAIEALDRRKEWHLAETSRDRTSDKE